MDKISLPDLHRRIADPATPPEELGRYFLVDEAASGPFDPALRYNPETVELPDTEGMRARGDVVLAGANGWARLRLPGPDEYAPHAEGGFPTPSGKVEFVSSVAAGGNFIDTANNYQDESSEEFIGEWMEQRGIRDQMVIATKVRFLKLDCASRSRADACC